MHLFFLLEDTVAAVEQADVDVEEVVVVVYIIVLGLVFYLVLFLPGRAGWPQAELARVETELLGDPTAATRIDREVARFSSPARGLLLRIYLLFNGVV